MQVGAIATLSGSVGWLWGGCSGGHWGLTGRLGAGGQVRAGLSCTVLKPARAEGTDWLWTQSHPSATQRPHPCYSIFFSTFSAFLFFPISFATFSCSSARIPLHATATPEGMQRGQSGVQAVVGRGRTRARGRGKYTWRNFSNDPSPPTKGTHPRTPGCTTAGALNPQQGTTSACCRVL